jgi:hypothetical protein
VKGERTRLKRKFSVAIAEPPPIFLKIVKGKMQMKKAKKKSRL